MIKIRLPSGLDYYNLYDLSGITPGKSLIITNHFSRHVFIERAVSKPSSSLDIGLPVRSDESAVVYGSGTTPIWVKGDDSPLFVQELTLQTADKHITVDLPKDFYTSNKEDYRRLRVDIGQTGFFEGREFRTFKEFSIAAASTLVLRIVVPINAILFEQGVEIDAGGIRIVNAAGGTAGGTFSETLPVIGKNNMTTRPSPLYTPQIVFTAGGTHTGGFVFDTHRAVAANATAQQSTVGNIVGDERGVAANTYYVRYENIGVATATGTLWFFWEERP